MKLKELIENLEAKEHNVVDLEDDISTGYCGDFLSLVLSKAPNDSAWFTVMNNINVAAVAHMTSAAVIVICEEFLPDQMLVDKCKALNINLISTKYDMFNAVKKAGL